MKLIIKSLLILCIFSQAFSQTPQDRYVIELKYLDAQNVANILNAVIQGSDQIIISADQLEAIGWSNVPHPTPNNLIITASHENYLRLKEFIESLDIPLPEVEEAMVYFPQMRE